jgi:Ca2+-binding EF-hand superfamily protein
MDPASAFWFICALIERILTPGFYIGGRTGNSLNGFYIEATAVAALLDYYFQPVREHDLPVTDFADCFSLPLLIQLFINSLDFPSTLFLWDLLFAEGSIALIRGVVCLAYLCEDSIRAGKHPTAIHRELSQRCVEKELRIKYPKLRIQVTAVRVERLRRQARDYRAYQWRFNKTMILRRLEFASRFSKPELLHFQAEFNSILQAKRVAEDKDRNRQLSSSRRKTVTLPKALQDEVGSLEGHVDIGITRFEFLGLLGSLEGRLLDHSDRLFDLFDEDKSGYLDFRELIVCLSVLTKGTFEDRLRLFFDIYDQDKSGCLRKADFQQLLYAVTLPYYEQLAQSFSRPTKSLMDTLYLRLNPLASTGLVTWPAFLTTVKSEDQVKHCFEQHVEVKAASKPTRDDDRERTATCVQCAIM